MRNGIKIAAAVLTAVLCVLGILYACVTFEITVQATGAGTLYAEKQRVHLLGSAKIRVYPSDFPEHTVLKRITVNGEDVTDRIHLQTFTVRYIRKDTVVFAEFESAAGKAVPANAPVWV